MNMENQDETLKPEAKPDCPPASCSACVQVLSHGDTEPQWASKLVWWLADVASRAHPWREPQVGDAVVEITHRLGMARHSLGLIDAVGELIAIEKDEKEGTIYTIRTLEGKERRWSNARMVVVDRPNVRMSEGADK